MKQHPNTVIINLGTSFDNRFPRIDNGKIFWFDLDQPDMIAAYQKAFNEEECFNHSILRAAIE